MSRAESRAQSTRSHLLQSGEQVFADLGYHGAGVAEICRRAGVSKGAFYHHFKSKQELFLAILDEWLGRLDTELAAVRRESEDSASALRAMAGLVRRVFADAQGHLPLLTAYWAEAVRDEQTWQAALTPLERYQSYFTQLAREGIEGGVITAPEPPEVIGRAVVAMAMGMLLQGLMDPDGADWHDTLQRAMAVLLRGMT